MMVDEGQPGAAVLGQVVCPGDTVAALPRAGVVRVGGGLVLRPGGAPGAAGELAATRPGVARAAPGGKLWVEGAGRRYLPSPGDAVLGVVTDRAPDGYELDIGGPFPAYLPVLAFEGATRANRPRLERGDLVYARVQSAGRDLPPELACTDAAGRGAGYGPLKGGTVVDVGCAHARALLAGGDGGAPHAALAALGAALAFEVAVGANGRAWVAAAGGPADAAAACRALRAAEGLAGAGAEAAVRAALRGRGGRASMET